MTMAKAKALRNLLDKIGVYAKFKDLFDSAIFLYRRMRNSVVISTP